MNRLNSILFESEVLEDAKKADVNGLDGVVSRIRGHVRGSAGFSKKDVDVKLVAVESPIMSGALTLKAGTHIRVVGAIANVDGEVAIVADHIEVKPLVERPVEDEDDENSVV